MTMDLIKILCLRFKYKFMPSEAQEFWAQELLEGQGLGAKIGQVLGQGKTSKLPKTSLSPKQAKEIFKQRFSVEIEISNEVFAASMGQVFFVKIRGKDYALKILHPGIKEKIKKEISNILILGGYFSWAKGFKFDKDIFRQFLTETFEEETDLKRESQFQKKFAQIYRKNKEIKIPEVETIFSDETFLCQESVHSILARDLSVISGFHILDFYFDSLLNHGLLHGDLNDRNWGINESGQTVVYDFGCTQMVSERKTEGLKKLIMNTDIINGFKEFGIRLETTHFKGLEQELRDTLFLPLFHHPIHPDFSLSTVAQKKFGDSIKQLREHTDPWVLLMMRSFFSIIRLYQYKKKEIPIQEIILPYLITKETTIKSTQIKIEVTEGTKQVIFMSLPMTALENLEGLMPENVVVKIKDEGINIDQIIEKVRSSDFFAQDLFKLSIDERSYRVWIE